VITFCVAELICLNVGCVKKKRKACRYSHLGTWFSCNFPFINVDCLICK